MASGFFALLDDIAALMDDVVVMSKITTKKTAGILGDDLAVNAEKATGFVSSRELPVLWAITKGSLLNKLIILPIAFLLSSFLPWGVVFVLVLGGIYLAYEGVEKIVEFFVPHKHEIAEIKKDPISEEEVLQLEKKKIKSAVLTDFILSVEIVIIALGTVLGKPILIQIMVVSIVALIATVGVYGIVAMIVRMDDLGYRLIKTSKHQNGLLAKIGMFLVQALPWVIKSLTVIGTIALILVAGGIFTHNIDFLHHFMEALPSFIKDAIVGLLVGFMAFLVVILFKRVYKVIKK
jgi:predicted DNA repair protein MutK